jgi:hypothetical protein
MVSSKEQPELGRLFLEPENRIKTWEGAEAGESVSTTGSLLYRNWKACAISDCLFYSAA